MLKKSKGNRFHQQGFIFSTFPINFIIYLTPYRKASVTGAFFIKESEDDMGVRVVFPDMGKDPSIQLIEKTITENGTYDAIIDGANGYSKVTVNVEGGGGSSDFSTAEVTFINSTSGSRAYTVHIAQVYDGQNGGIAIGNLNVGKEEPITIKVPLYKNNYSIHLNEIENASSSVMPTATGDITFSSQGFLIQGNGTITMSSN